MSIETGRVVVDATLRSALNHGHRRIKLKYAGGEPLLRFTMVEELHRYAQSVAYESGLELDGVVLSNGTLLNSRVVETIQSLGLRLMISLDGLEQYHDRQRPYANGHRSFVDVEHAIDTALSYGLVPAISITVGGGNIKGLPALISWILDRDLPFSLNFYRENRYCSSNEVLKTEASVLVDGMLATYGVIESNLPNRSLLSSLVDHANLAVPHHHPCGVGHSYLVFDTEGRVSKCQMNMDATLTDVTARDPLAMVQADKAGLQNPPVEEKSECRECQWKYWCAGGCPLAAYQTSGQYSAKSPKCSIYQALYPHVLRLEGLRLLEYATSDS